MQNLSVTILPALLACVLATSLPAQNSLRCPNVRATNVPARVTHQGGYARCGFGVELFGVPISIGGAKCFRNEFVYPAHQECQGALNAGTACVPAPDMSVQLNRCDCLTVGLLSTGISIPKCSCSSAGTAGTIEDAQTVECHVAP